MAPASADAPLQGPSCLKRTILFRAPTFVGARAEVARAIAQEEHREFKAVLSGVWWHPCFLAHRSQCATYSLVIASFPA
jgi:hypothetical protein